MSKKEKLERELTEWRRNPTRVIRCPQCNGLGGLHAAACDLDARNAQGGHLS